ncbi:MAG: glycosyltransferase family 1 protein, partial [Thermosynechococcaceae cyanobacterium]
MQIFSVHNFYQIRGGEDESCESEERLLRERGHQVDTYRENNNRVQSLSKVQLAARTIWSRETYRKVQAQLEAGKPYDIVHVQNFFPLISPAVHYAAKSKGVPVIQTLRNYRLLCPNALFFRDGQVCEDCLGKPIPYPGVVHNCYREDKGASLSVAAMITAHRGLRTWTTMVDRFIALTNFAR